MRIFAPWLLLAAVLASVPRAACSEDDLAAVAEPADDESAAVVSAPAQDETAASPDANGQWVYTQQYGWVWMPYGDAYTYAPPGGAGQPYQYVYYPAYAEWTWLVAPWVWGYGPWPYFGVYGPARFGWYGHGWWRTPGRWHYWPAPYRNPAFAGRGASPFYRGAPGARAAPYRGAFGARAAAPATGFAPRGAARGFAVGSRSGGFGGGGRAGGGAHFGGGGHSGGGGRGGHR